MWSPRQVTHLPLCGIFYFPWHRHQIEGTNGFYCLIRKTERFTISNVESQVFTPNNSRLDPGSNPGCPRDKRMSYHWTNCASWRYWKNFTTLRDIYANDNLIMRVEGSCNCFVSYICLVKFHLCLALSSIYFYPLLAGHSIIIQGVG